MADSWERLLHEVVEKHLLADLAPCRYGEDGKPCGEPNCFECETARLYERYRDHCQRHAHLFITPAVLGTQSGFSVDEIMEHAAEQRRERQAAYARLDAITEGT